MTSATFSDFLTPSPPCPRWATGLYYKIHATSLTLSAFPLPPSPLGADVINGWPLFEISESVGDTRPEHRGRLPRRGAFPTGMGKERPPPPHDSASSKRDKMSQAVTTPVNMPSWPPGTALASSTANRGNP